MNRADVPGPRTSDAEIVAMAGARHGDPFAVLGPHAVTGGPSIRAFAPGAAKRDGAARTAATRSRWMRAATTASSRALTRRASDRLRYRLRARKRRRRVGLGRPLRASARCSARWTTICWSKARIAAVTSGSAPIRSPRGRRGRPFRGLGAARPARLRRRRLQRLGRAPPPDAQARRLRPVGDLRPGPSPRRASTNTRSSSRDGALLPLKADPFGFAAGTAALDRLGRRPDRAISPGPTPIGWRSARKATRAARRCRSTRSISAPGGAATDGALPQL